MRIIFLFGVVFFGPCFAAEAEAGGNTAPVIEPVSDDINRRLERIEKILDNKALLNLLERVESLEVEISTLRGELEVQKHTVEQLKQKQRDLYTDVDKRLQLIESNKSTADISTIRPATGSTINDTEATQQAITTDKKLPTPMMLKNRLTG